MPLNCDWLKICPHCKVFWCSKGAKCGSPECECTAYLTVKDFRDDMVIIQPCGPCLKKTADWLKKLEPPKVLTFKPRELYHDDDEALTFESGER